MKEILFENEHVRIEVDNGILIGIMKYKIIDLQAAKVISAHRLENQQGTSFPIISNIKQVKTVTKEARDFLASEEGCEGVIAAAVLIDSVIGSMIGNFFIRISKPLRPTKIFTDEVDAKKWLEQFKPNKK